MEAMVITTKVTSKILILTNLSVNIVGINKCTPIKIVLYYFRKRYIYIYLFIYNEFFIIF